MCVVVNSFFACQSVVTVGLYKAAMESAKEKDSEVQTKQMELDFLKNKMSKLEHRLFENEKKHSNTLSTTLQLRADKTESQKKIAELEKQLNDERHSSQVAVQTAKEETQHLRNKVEDMEFEQAEGGKRLTKPPSRNVLQSSVPTAPRAISPSPRNQVFAVTTGNSGPARMTPKKTVAVSMTPTRTGKTSAKAKTAVVSMTPSRTGKTPTKTRPLNNENAGPTPSKVGGKNFGGVTCGGKRYRSKFDFVKSMGGRKAMQGRIQEMRSPKGRQTVKI